MMPTNKKSVQCNIDIRKELDKRIRSSTVKKSAYDRAKIIVLHLDGNKNAIVARKLNLRPHTVGKWVNRFKKEGIEGLEDKPRSGRPKQYGSREKKLILEIIGSPPPKGQAAWDGKSIACALGFPPYAVWSILKKEGIHLNRKRTWCISKDKQFAQKAADIVGLYMDPPANAIVFSVDEKPSIQALKRAQGFVQTANRKIIRGEQSTYKRNGITNLMAALEVSTGRVITKTTPQKKRKDFLLFMDEVVTDIPSDTKVHVIVDNYCTHKNNDDWLERHPNVEFHFTPTSASWLNMIEIWFGMLSRKALKGASFDSVDELCKAIADFVEVYHKNAKPFKWRKREVNGSQLRNTVANFLN